MLLFQDDHKVLIRSTLKDLEEKLSSHTEFLRIHRSYIVNMNKVGSYTSSSLTISKVQLPIGKTYRLLVKEYWEEMNRRVG
jgi:DNA-binding LytR/AlgR family response regulator